MVHKMKFGIIEVGSTNTKAYIYDEGRLKNLGSHFIAFKTNYKEDGHLRESDVEELIEFIRNIKKETPEVHVFGTSIFRNLKDDERKSFLNLMKERLDIDFKIVTSDEESEYTVKGVIANIDYGQKMAVIIGGGGSTEIAIIDHKNVVKKLNLNFGAMDITEKYPELKSDTVVTPFEEMLRYTSNLVGNLDDDVECAVLAGGDYIYFYETVGYEMAKNTLYEDINQPFMIDFPTADNYDHDILSKSLDAIKEKCKDNTGWWDGARGMRFCMNAIARKLRADYIIPTRINMLIGLADEIIKTKTAE